MIVSYFITVKEIETSFTRTFYTDVTDNLFIVNSLHPFYNYNCSVAAVTIGLGPATFSTVQTLPEGNFSMFSFMSMCIVLFNSEPSDVPQNVTVVALNASSAYLSWIPPPLEDRNGIIIGYVVRVCGVNTDEEIELSVVDLHTTVVGLHPFYSYRFSVAAVTVATGPFNNPIGLSLPESGKQLYIKKVW